MNTERTIPDGDPILDFFRPTPRPHGHPRLVCEDQADTCRGPIETHTITGTDRFPACRLHFAERLAVFEHADDTYQPRSTVNEAWLDAYEDPEPVYARNPDGSLRLSGLGPIRLDRPFEHGV